MMRRDFITLAGGTVIAWPLMAQAEEKAVPVPRIAYLGASSPASLDPRQIEQFKVGLTENGLIDGQNIRVDYLWGEGNPDRLRQHAADLAKRNLSVIVTAGPQPLRALLEAKVSSPIVFAILSDPISDGFVQSLARPGGNITGLSMIGTDLESKRLQILKEGVPGITKVMLLHDPTMGSTIGLEQAKSSASGLGLEIVVGKVADVGKLADIFAEALQQNVNGVAGLASPFINFNRKRLIDLCSQYRLPSIWEAVAYIRDGGLISYGPSFPEMYRRSAGYVARILKGTKPSDLPVEQPTRFELAVNLKTAKILGLAMPPTLLGRADEVIE
jgi:putative tryptophan/tyrosine transport system substrate-binding protein